jgi:DNA-binding LytR/AlgR family response regulator
MHSILCDGFFRFPVAQKGESLRPESVFSRHTKGEITFVYPPEFFALKTGGNRLRLCHTSGPYLIRGLLSSIAEKLSAFGFVRIHRSVVAKVAQIEDLG